MNLTFDMPDVDFYDAFKNKNYKNFIKALSTPQNKGEFDFIDLDSYESRSSKKEDILLAFKKELSENALFLIEDVEINYGNTIYGQRDCQRYLFYLNSKHSINEEIQQELPSCPSFSIKFPQKTYTFYIVLNPWTLSEITKIFNSWLLIQRQIFNYEHD